MYRLTVPVSSCGVRFIRNSCIGVLTLFATSPANGQDSSNSLFNYPNTRINGLTSAELQNKSMEECRQICIERSGCAGFDHSEKGACRIFANVGSATSAEGSTSETRVLLSTYRAPTNPPPDWAAMCEQEARPTKVKFKDISATHAIEVCRRAALAASANPDVWAFYARALDKGGQVEESVKWATKSAERSSAFGQYYLGLMHEDGRGVRKDAAEAARLYRLAVEQGLAAAQNNLGRLYEDGRGVHKDVAEAARLYRLAADQGLASGQTNLGLAYKNGRGLREDAAEAARLYRLAADQGEAAAQNNLGMLYETGRGVPKNEVEAAQLYRLAANQGHPVAQNNLGVLYQTGRGVPKDEDEAVRLYQLAADQGLELAKKNLLLIRPNAVPQ